MPHLHSIWHTTSHMMTHYVSPTDTLSLSHIHRPTSFSLTHLLTLWPSLTRSLIHSFTPSHPLNNSCLKLWAEGPGCVLYFFLYSISQFWNMNSVFLPTDTAKLGECLQSLLLLFFFFQCLLPSYSSFHIISTHWRSETSAHFASISFYPNYCKSG